MRLNVEWSREGLTFARCAELEKFVPKLSISYGNSIQNLFIVRYSREMKSRKAYITTYARLNKYQLCSSSGRHRLNKLTIKIDQIEVYITAQFFDGSARIKLYMLWLWLTDGCGGGGGGGAAKPL